jgi:signal transduction histidine kinase/archaeosine-15-forming tRNA-guanine transglycosylase
VRFERLKLSLIAAFLLVAMVPLSGLVYLVETDGERLIKEKVSSHLLGLSAKSADEISRFILERRNDIRMLSHAVPAGDVGSDAALKHNFARMKENYRAYIDFFVTDARGRLTFRGLKPGIPAEELIGHKTDIRLSGGGEAASDVFLLAVDGARIPVILMSTPVSDPDGRPMATLFAIVDFRQATEALNTVIEKTGEVYLVNQKGYFISSSRFGVEVLKDRIPPSLQRPGDRVAGSDEPIDYRGKNVLHAYRRIADFNWYVIAEQDRDEALLELYRFRKFTIAYVTATILAVFGLAYGIATLLVNRLRRTYRREKELEFQVTRKDKLAALGLLSAGLAHELNTPLADALLYTQMIQEELDENDRELIRKRLATIEEVIKHGSLVVKNLLAYTRHTQSGAETTSIAETFEKLLNLVGPHCDSKKIKIVSDMEPSMPKVRAETGIVQEILTNLVANAIDAMPQGGTLKLTARYMPVLEKVRIDVADTGQGIPSHLLRQVFDPFFTTKPPGEGTGLGLFVSYEMARRLGGSMRVISTQGDGTGRGETIFTVELPVDLDGTARG